MDITARYLAPQPGRDLKRKMVFIAGPRQVGKTILARSLPDADGGCLADLGDRAEGLCEWGRHTRRPGNYIAKQSYLGIHNQMNAIL